MGGFTKPVGKFITKNLDPMHMVGLGKYQKQLRKVIDPLNIMDPLNVLPTSGDKWLTVDKNYGAPLMNFISPKQQNTFMPMTKGLSSKPEYFQQQQQMLNNMQTQQRQKLADLRTQAPSYPSLPSNASTDTSVAQTAQQSITPTTLAQTKIGDTNVPSDLPMDFVYKPVPASPKIVQANTFQMPNVSDLKFGGA